MTPSGPLPAASHALSSDEAHFFELNSFLWTGPYGRKYEQTYNNFLWGWDVGSKDSCRLAENYYRWRSRDKLLRIFNEKAFKLKKKMEIQVYYTIFLIILAKNIVFVNSMAGTFKFESLSIEGWWYLDHDT